MTHTIKNVLLSIFALSVAILASSTSFAGFCKSNSWTPTFVHNGDCRSEKTRVNGRNLPCYGGPYYVMRSSTGRYEFIKLRGYEPKTWRPDACSLIRQFGIRDRRGFTNCRNYTRIQCTCSRYYARRSAVCSAFLRAGCTTRNGKYGANRC